MALGSVGMKLSGVGLAVVAGAGLAACSLDSSSLGTTSSLAPSSLSLSNVAGYQAANMFLTTGYNETQIAADHYEVRANGTDQTSKERVERIALARAAEIGVENKLAYFKVNDTRHGAVCKAKQTGYKSADAGAVRYPTVILDVSYAQAPADANWQEAKSSFDRIKGELAAETPDAALKAAAAADIKDRCGGR